MNGFEKGESDMIEITLILPGGRRGRGRIDLDASFEVMKSDIVNAYGLGNPDDYEIAISTQSKKQSAKRYALTSDDIIYLIRVRDLRGSAFEHLAQL